MGRIVKKNFGKVLDGWWVGQVVTEIVVKIAVG